MRRTSVTEALTMQMNHTRNPIDAQARGRRRVYKQKLAADYAAFDAIWKSLAASTQISDFMYKSGKGRRRIFDRINAAVTRCGGRLEALRLDGKHPLALWAILRPGATVTLDPDH